MFVQTHFQRKPHQTALAQFNHQTTVNYKQSKSSISCSSNKKLAKSETRACKISETYSHDTDFERAKSKVINSYSKGGSLGYFNIDCHSLTNSASSISSRNSKHNVSSYSGNQNRFNHNQLMVLEPSRQRVCQYPRHEVKNVDSTSASKQNMLFCNKSDHCAEDLSRNRSPYFDKENLETTHHTGTIVSSVMENFTDTLILFARSLTNKLFANDDVKNGIVKGDLSVISSLMKANLELVVSFSLNLASYQLETWRLMLDDTYTNSDAPLKEVCKRKYNEYCSLDTCCSINFAQDMKFKEPSRKIQRFPEEVYSGKTSSSMVQHVTKTSNPHSHRSNQFIVTDIKCDENKQCNRNINEIKSQSHCSDGTSGLAGNYCLHTDQSKPFNSHYLNNSIDIPLTIEPEVDILSQNDAATHVDSSLISGTDNREVKKEADQIRSSRKLSLTGSRGRIWFSEKKSNQMSVRRSEEILPELNIKRISPIMSSDNEISSSANYLISTSGSFGSSVGSSVDKMNFVDGLGLGQIVSRHALVSSVAGEIQLYLTDTRGILEMAVIQARGLQAKGADKDSLPSTYAKVYLMRNRKCIAKYKTRTAPKTADPFYHQKFIYREGHANCIIQVIIWGDSSKKSKKSLLGAAQIQLDNLDISKSIVSWYKLFDIPSMSGPFYSSKSLRRRLLSLLNEKDFKEISEKLLD